MGCAQSQQPLPSPAPAPAPAAPFRRMRTLEDPEDDGTEGTEKGNVNPAQSMPKLPRGHSNVSATSSISNISLHRDDVQTMTMKSTKNRPNQDTYCAVEDNGFSVYGVFDGHGKSGHRVSKFVRDHLPRIILQDGRLGSKAMPDLMKDAFAQMAMLVREATKTGKLEAQRSGTTATIIVHDQQANHITVSYVGDSGAALAKAKGSSYRAHYLTPDHKPNVPGERKRILNSGGAVSYNGACWRCYKKGSYGIALNMSRCFGDLQLHQVGVISEPDTYQVKLTRRDKFLMLCSDGVWEYMSATEAVECVQKALRSCADGAKALAREATDRWADHPEVDDITAVIILLQQEGRPPTTKLKQTQHTLKRAGSDLSQGSSASSATSSASSSTNDGRRREGGSRKLQQHRRTSLHSSSSGSVSTGGDPPFTLKLSSAAAMQKSDSESSISSSGPQHTTLCVQKSIPAKPMKRYFVPEKRLG